MAHYNDESDSPGGASSDGGGSSYDASRRPAETPANPFLGITRERRPKEQRPSVAVRDPANQLSFVKVRTN